ncbi:MAG: hypothetical protein Q7U23_06895 [Methylococcales bacterium]|nr:hypothetical protein [Methylococcales bacterium]
MSKTQVIESRYKIQDNHIIDTKKEINAGKPIYIRDILDSGSNEFSSSKISAKDRLDIVGQMGLKTLIPVLEECFKNGNKNYNASHEALFALSRLLNNTYPQLTFYPMEDSNSKLTVQLLQSSIHDNKSSKETI